jgi:hypothetical protein
MMPRNKNTKRYSYTNHDSRESKYINKNFNKTESYHSNFSGVLFQNTSLIGAKFKFSAFYGAQFDSCYIRGTLLRKCNFEKALFKNSIISATVFERCNFKDAFFKNCKIVSSTKIEKFLPSDCFDQTEILDAYPDEADFDPILISKTEDLRTNEFIRRSSVLHRKMKKLDTVSLKVLVDEFGENFLVSHIEKLPEIITKEFYTLSYIMHYLRKMQKYDSI